MYKCLAEHESRNAAACVAHRWQWICDRAFSLCLSDHETGVPVAVDFAAQAPKTEANKREVEQTVALRLYENTDLDGATITGDALNCNEPQAQAILQSGGDYFLQLKNENRHAYQSTVRIAEEDTLFCLQPNTRHLTRTLQ